MIACQKIDAAGPSDHPVRILKIVPKYPPPVVGGLERQAEILASELVRQGQKVTVLSDCLFGGRWGKSLSNGVRVIRSPKFIDERCSRIISLVFVVLYILVRRRGYDVVHVHNLSMIGAFSALAARLAGKPSLLKVPNVGIAGIKGFIGEGKSAWLRKKLLRQATGLIALTPVTFEEASAIGYPRDRIFLRMNGIETEHYKNRKHEADSAGLRFLFVGRMVPQKGVAELLEVWPEVRKNFLNARLGFCGTGPLYDELLPRRDELVEQGVDLFGHSDNVSNRLQEADVFVLPSHREGNSNAILEAMASGLPVVSTRVGGTADLVGANGAQFLYEPGDKHSLLRLLLTMASDPALRARLGALMRERCEEFFSIDQTAREYLKIYRALGQVTTHA